MIPQIFMVITLLLPAVSLLAQPQIYYHPDSTRKVSQLTGDYDRPFGIPTVSLTDTRASLYATDLGSTFEHNGSLVYLFGDTWGGRDGLLDCIAFSQSTDPWSIQLQFPLSPDGKWRPMLPPSLNLAEFCVPSHGISIDGTMYVVYTQPGTDGEIMKRSWMISSSDNGITWQTLYQLDNGSESNPKFINVWLEEHNNFIYMFGSGAYRASSPYLARAPKSSFPDKTAWTYFTGRNLSEEVQWSSQIENGVQLFTHNQIGEFSCSWISALNCWVMLYNSSNPRGITMRTAANPWGPWSTGKVIMHPDTDEAYGNYMHVNWNQDKRDLFHDLNRENEWGGEYGPYLIPRYTRGTANQCEIFYTMSTWNPYQVVLMRSVLSTIPPPTPLPTTIRTLGHDLWHRYPANVADSFTYNGRPNLTTYNGDENTGWLWQKLPKETKSLTFTLHGGHAEIFLLENSSGLPPTGNIETISRNLRSGIYGRIVRRATGVDTNESEISWTWKTSAYQPESLVLVILDSFVDAWGFLSFSDIEITQTPPPAAIHDWVLY